MPIVASTALVHSFAYGIVLGWFQVQPLANVSGSCVLTKR